MFPDLCQCQLSTGAMSSYSTLHVPKAGILAPVLRVNSVSDMVLGCSIKSGVFLRMKFAS